MAQAVELAKHELLADPHLQKAAGHHQTDQKLRVPAAAGQS